MVTTDPHILALAAFGALVAAGFSLAMAEIFRDLLNLVRQMRLDFNASHLKGTLLK